MSRLVVLARIADQRVAFDAASIEAVVDISAVTPVPFAPPHLLGLTAFRSQVVTVVDPAAAIGVGACHPIGRALLITADGHRYAIRVDAVEDVLATSEPAPIPPHNCSGGWDAVVIGRIDMINHYALLIDAERLIGDGEPPMPQRLNPTLTAAD